MVEMHLLRVNEDFRYDPIFALGVVTTFDQFMEGYEPQQDQASIFNALCKAEEVQPEVLRQDSQRLLELSQSKSVDELIDWISQSVALGGDDIQQHLQTIAQNDRFKYSRLFAVGLFTMLGCSDGEIVKDEARLTEALQKICGVLNLSETKLQKDLELYQSNLNKLAQARQTMADIQEAERKRRLQATTEKSQPQNSEPEDASPLNSDAPLEISS